MPVSPQRLDRPLRLHWLPMLVLVLGVAITLPDPGWADSTALTVALSPARTQTAILQAVAGLAPDQLLRRRYRIGVPFGAPLFPDDAALAATPASPALVRWLALPIAQRWHDVLIAPDVDYFWIVDGSEFSCQFIVHVQVETGTQSATQSRLELIQLQPLLRYANKFHLLGRTGPGWYTDVRPTAPSAQAEADLRTWLSTALALAPAHPP